MPDGNPRLHPAAAAAFDAKGEAIAASVEASVPPPTNPAATGDAHISETITSADPLAERRFDVGIDGRNLSCEFGTRTRGYLRIAGDGHKELNALCDNITRQRAIGDLASAEFLYDAAIDWLAARADGETTNLCRFLETRLDAAVEKVQVWLPLPVVSIPQPILIGRTTFRRVTKPMIDAFLAKAGVTPDQRSAGADFYRQRVQASTAACVEVEAEPIRAAAKAAEEAESSIAMLRLVCPVNGTARRWIPISPTEIDRTVGQCELTVKAGFITRSHMSSPAGMLNQWPIQRDDLPGYNAIWRFGHDLILANRNPFQDLLLGAIVHFSKSILKPDPAERLMYVTTALESLLVDKNENILQNLRERLAVTSPKKGRLACLKLVNKVYQMRSDFVHLAVPTKDLELLTRFLWMAWSLILFLLANHERWRSKAELLQELDAHKFTGPDFSTATPRTQPS